MMPRLGLMPLRIQRKRTRGWRMPAGAICVTRPGRWSNPFRIEYVGADRLWTVRGPAGGIAGSFVREADARKTSIDFYSRSFSGAELHAAQAALRGHDLCCFCCEAPPGIADRDWCHAGWLIEVANGLRCDAAEAA